MNLYSIYNEDGDKMRVVRRLEEAKALIANKPDWTYKLFRTPKKEPEQYNFEEAPF
jgi:hypothetical protein